MMKWIGVSTNIAISLKMCLQDLSISERSPRDMTNSNEILKALSLWLAPFMVTYVKWQQPLDLEVHFFFDECSAIQARSTYPISSESSGDTQHYLLLEVILPHGHLCRRQSTGLVAGATRAGCTLYRLYQPPADQSLYFRSRYY